MNIALIPNIEGTSGPASFRRRIAQGLEAEGMHLVQADADVVLVIGGTRRLDQLVSLKRSGIPIIHRLNGMNWMHRRVRTGLRHFVKAEYGNLLLRIIRNRFANHVVYQSQFARDWWTETHGMAPSEESVVYNAAPLQTFTPMVDGELPDDGWRFLILEGKFEGGYETGLRASFDMLAHLQTKIKKPLELTVAGGVPERVRQEFTNAPVPVDWPGVLQGGEVPRTLNQAHVLLSADINPACPNSVIEALACGTPVVGFDTGAMGELVSEDSGMLAHYGSDPWMLGRANVQGLAEATMMVLGDLERFSVGARAQAERLFGLDDMVAGYVRAFSRAMEA